MYVIFSNFSAEVNQSIFESQAFALFREKYFVFVIVEIAFTVKRVMKGKLVIIAVLW